MITGVRAELFKLLEVWAARNPSHNLSVLVTSVAAGFNPAAQVDQWEPVEVSRLTDTEFVQRMRDVV